MSNYDPTQQDLDDLLRQVDSLLEEEPEQDDWYDDPPVVSIDDRDIDQYTPQDARQDDTQIFYQNAANGYGSQVRNFRNNYGAPQPEPEPPTPRYDYRQTEDEYIEQVYNQPSIPAYNADFHQPKRERSTKSQAYKAQTQRKASRRTEYPDYAQEIQQTSGKPVPSKKRKRPGCLGCGCGTVLVVLALLAVMAFGVSFWIFDRPEAAVSIGPRKSDTAAVLICGTDEDGTRTDTMMLLYLSGSEKKVGLLSLPRDTYTIATAGYAAKLNSAYGRNNCGVEGMEALLDYIQDIIGYRPDGYVLVDMSTVPKIVDLMGGVEVDVPHAIEDEVFSMEAGLQRLNGEQTLNLLRHRRSYATADLGRIEVQRLVVEACMKQWVSLSKLGSIREALALVEETSITNMGTRNYLWIGKTLLKSLSGGIVTETLPGYADYIGDASYYILDAGEVAQMINSHFNPYDAVIGVDDLNIAG